MSFSVQRFDLFVARCATGAPGVTCWPSWDLQSRRVGTHGTEARGCHLREALFRAPRLHTVSIHSKCPFQYLALKNSSFWTVPKCPSHCLSCRDAFYSQFQDWDPIVASRRAAAYLRRSRNEQREEYSRITGSGARGRKTGGSLHGREGGRGSLVVSDPWPRYWPFSPLMRSARLCAFAPSPAIHLLTGRDSAAPGRGWSASQIVPVPTSSLRDVAWADCCDWAPRLGGTRPPVLRCTARWRPANSSH
jgi:hypothetical protein